MCCFGSHHIEPLAIEDCHFPRRQRDEPLAGEIAQQARYNLTDRAQMLGQFVLRKVDDTHLVGLRQQQRYQPFLLRQPHRSFKELQQ